MGIPVRNDPRTLAGICQPFHPAISFMDLPVENAILGSYSVWSGGTGTGNLMAPYNTPENNLIMGIVALAGFCILVAYRHVAAPAGGFKK
jgi:hypothetical protein